MKVAAAVVLARFFAGLGMEIPVAPEIEEGRGRSLLRTNGGGDLPEPSPEPYYNQDRHVEREVYKSKEGKVRKVNIPELSPEPWKEVEEELSPLIAGGDYRYLLRKERSCPKLSTETYK